MKEAIFKLAKRISNRTTPVVTVANPRVEQSNQTALKGAVIGLGVIGREHISAIQTCAQTELVATSSRNKPAISELEQAGVTHHTDFEELVRSGGVDFVAIATPHPSHFDIVKTALDAGVHVVCEKPLCIDGADARRLEELARDRGLLLRAAFQTRYSAEVKFVKQLIASGDLGRILRCEISENYWRSASYYSQSEWRGTWATEGGGVLVNQAPHVLDRYLHLFGLPHSVTGVCDTVMHEIEVEDTVTAILRHENGMHGIVRVSTAEAPWRSRLYVAGDKGTVEVENGLVRQTQFQDALQTAYMQDQGRVPDQEMTVSEFRVESAPHQPPLVQLYNAFARDIAMGQSSDDDPAGVRQVALSNAILLSHFNKGRVELPATEKEVSDLMSKLGVVATQQSD